LIRMDYLHSLLGAPSRLASDGFSAGAEVKKTQKITSKCSESKYEDKRARLTASVRCPPLVVPFNSKQGSFVPGERYLSSPWLVLADIFRVRRFAHTRIADSHSLYTFSLTPPLHLSDPQNPSLFFTRRAL
jgi:hypothetical protein